MTKIIIKSKFFRDPLPVCASEKYLKSASSNYGWFVDSQFVLPFFIIKRAFFNLLVFTTGVIYQNPDTSVIQEKEFLLDVIAKSRQLNVDFIAQPKTTARFNAFPDGAIHMEWGSYQVDLLKSEESLFAGLHSHHRRVIRKAQRDGVFIQSGPKLIKECHELIQWTLQRQRRPFVSLEQLNSYQEHLQDNINFYLASYNGANQGCAILVSDSSSCYYIHGGSRVRPHNGAMALLHWTAMLEMKEKGVQTYDFVGGRVNPVKGSKQEAIQRFKSRFGGGVKKGYLWKYPLKPWKYNLYQTIFRLRDMAMFCKYSEDIIDNEIRTAHLTRSKELKH